ncbi:MAG: hypothetical protein K5657_04780 [Desulfovibrio sp.]|nr:hypothetical protein [Desulfovibrio sp.]
MKQKKSIAVQSLLCTLLGAVFCFWTVQGNDVNFCHTAGCTLYQDLRIAGFSLWWFGLLAFLVATFLTLLAPLSLALVFLGMVLFCDLGLLLLMSVTAPCMNCLGVAILFALGYQGLLRVYNHENGLPKSRSFLLTAWLILFSINAGNVLRLEAGPWPMLGEKDASVHIFFSPSCAHCRDAISFYGGSVNVAFYPVAENEGDIYRIKAMEDLLKSDVPIEEALAKSRNAEPWPFLAHCRPENLLLSFRLIVNKAHVFSSDSKGVPFLEFRGVPKHVAKELKKRRMESLEGPAASTVGGVNSELNAAPPPAKGKEQDLTGDVLDLFQDEAYGQCKESTPCP